MDIREGELGLRKNTCEIVIHVLEYHVYEACTN